MQVLFEAFISPDRFRVIDFQNAQDRFYSIRTTNAHDDISLQEKRATKHASAFEAYAEAQDQILDWISDGIDDPDHVRACVESARKLDDLMFA